MGIALIIATNAGSVVIAAYAWHDLDFYLVGLFASIVASIVFLWLYAMKIEYFDGSIVLKFPMSQKEFRPDQVADARIIQRRGSEYLRIKFSKGFGPRKVFYFAIHQNGQDIADFLNEMMKYGVKVYANRSLETKVYFSKERGQFECTF
jgi:hypothetical protein